MVILRDLVDIIDVYPFVVWVIGDDDSFEISSWRFFKEFVNEDYVVGTKWGDLQVRLLTVDDDGTFAIGLK